MSTLLTDGKVKYLPSFELKSFVSISTNQLAFVYLKKEDFSITYKSLNCEMHDEIYVQVFYIYIYIYIVQKPKSQKR